MQEKKCKFEQRMATTAISQKFHILKLRENNETSDVTKKKKNTKSNEDSLHRECTIYKYLVKQAILQSV